MTAIFQGKRVTNEKKSILSQISQAFKVHPIIAILGPRQCGKTTLARMYANEYFPVPRKITSI